MAGVTADAETGTQITVVASADPSARRAAAPLISVVMPTYNGERFLRPAIESILGQSFRDFELLVIDDGSDDGTPDILREFAAQDDRVRVLTNPRNMGIAAATNRGLAAARGEYIALQDHDDISLPHRFQTELDFLHSHPDIALVGSAATLIDENGDTYATYVEVADDIEIKWEALFRCPISHTSVMVRRNVMSEVGGYSRSTGLEVASDYDLLSRIALGYRVANLNEPLVRWRRHRGASMISREAQLQVGIESVSLRNIGALAYGERSFTAPDRNYWYLGSRAFLCSPAGELPKLPPEQVIAGLEFLCELQERFCRKFDSPRPLTARLRRRLNWTCGKHALALAVRTQWDWRSRARICALGLRCFGQAVRVTSTGSAAGAL